MLQDINGRLTGHSTLNGGHQPAGNLMVRDKDRNDTLGLSSSVLVYLVVSCSV